jgi:hypothetical protein|tara:strand:+ start:291 stop:545 length:255 start_codon:yes stop_codon:yes gene_type:complete
MKRSILVVAAGLMVALGSTAALADPQPPYPTEEYLYINRYYNMSGELVGWDIVYCDLTTESYMDPFESPWSIETDDRGNCTTFG